jgi:hypothetical protein
MTPERKIIRKMSGLTKLRHGTRRIKTNEELANAIEQEKKSMLQKELYNFESVYKFTQRTCTVF